MINPYLIFFLVVLFLYSCGESGMNKKPMHGLEQKTIDRIVNQIAAENGFMGSAVGIAGEEPIQWRRYDSLRKGCFENQLIALTKHPNAVVKCYAFQALASNNYTKLFDILLAHIKDSTEVSTLFGCIASKIKVGDLFLDVLSEKGILMSSSQKSTLDSILLFDKKIHLDAKSRLLDTLIPLQKNYRRIREMVYEEKNHHALISLSKYRNNGDKKFIQDFLKGANCNSIYYGLLAAVQFPHKDFFQDLQITRQKIIGHNCRDNLLGVYYQALVQYKNAATRKILEEELKISDRKELILRTDLMHQAVKIYPHKVFDSLIKFDFLYRTN